jgi:hypothetical protein
MNEARHKKGLELVLSEHVLEHMRAAGFDPSGIEPYNMPKPVYLMLQRKLEIMDAAVARGEDCADGFDQRFAALDKLMSSADVPWTMHPDHGCILKELPESGEVPAWAIHAQALSSSHDGSAQDEEESERPAA